ncbi:translation initiation factor IF-2-like isoform X2 [Grus americana]|uniref:translation initiation factor IF-2-like isoform X2 n=1 Tax=Grus americana TaxID=9117 RepID=UPI002407C17A|nr:translation initiation factor IF-2-like isoform X2 [Grus americana]
MEGPRLPRQGGAHSDTGPGGAGWRGWAGRWLLSSAAPAPLNTPRPTWRTLNLDWPPLSANPSATAIPTLHRAGARAQRRPGESARSAGTGARARERGRARGGRAAGTGHYLRGGGGAAAPRGPRLAGRGGGEGRRRLFLSVRPGPRSRLSLSCAGEGALRSSGDREVRLATDPATLWRGSLPKGTISSSTMSQKGSRRRRKPPDCKPSALHSSHLTTSW